MKKIIVPVDFSEDSLNALNIAILLAEKMQANIQLIHVNKTRTLAGLFGGSKSSLSQSEIEENFQSLIQNTDHKGLVINYTVRQGSVATEVANYAEEIDAYMIVMGTHGASGFEEFWMGSNSYKVVSNAPCPVLTLRSNFKSDGFKTIVLPIDTTVTTRQKVPFTAEIAKLFKAEVHVVSVCTDESEEFVRKLTSYAAQTCRFLNDKGIDTINEFITADNITNSTIEYATKVGADLIAIMTEQETALENAFLGAYAQQMVNHSQIPVLSLQKNPDLMGDVSIM